MRLTVTLISIVWFLVLASCRSEQAERRSLEEIAGNEEVLAFMKTFDGRGALSDSSQPLSPQNSLGAFQHANDIQLELVLSEPDVSQPVFIDFDHRGRLWVVQYNQYPYPRDLKVISMDQHIRATFDKIPPPPGKGARGADKITVFEDNDGDGTFEKSTDAITGLNIATSVAFGRGNIWVMNPPYLLAYPDSDDDGTADGPPLVHLEGFGIEDTHAVANNIRWGPDGWLYGAQGSTCTANVSSQASKNIRFDGQAIWRYHPGTKIFEVYAEGGGNTFDIEIDEKGRFYSGDNGTSRGQYYKQGAYYVRNFGKHGALTNPYAFGFLSNMELTGENVRFTHAFVKYEGAGLPADYNGKMIAINPLQSYVQLSAFESNGSTFRIADEKRIIETDDNWFRPVDITTGPDGAVYIADWYDSRLSHVDPRDTWSKSNGRIYRIEGKAGHVERTPFNLRDLSGTELIRMLSHPNRWFRQRALVVFGDRKDASLIPALTTIFTTTDKPQLALEALWALHLSEGFNDSIATKGLKHNDAFVRMWAVRLAGEQPLISGVLGDALAKLAAREEHPEVRSQLAASAKRLQGDVSLAIINNLLRHHDDSADPDIPLQLWWALESKIDEHNSAVLALFQDRALWKTPTVKKHILERLMQRYAMQEDSAGFASCARLIRQAPSTDDVKLLVNGLQEGLRGGETRLTAELQQALKPYNKYLNQHSLAISLRQGDGQAVATALALITDRHARLTEKLACIRVFGEIDQPECVPVLLRVVEDNQSTPALKEASLLALQRYDHDEIGRRVVKAYPDKLRADPGVRLAALSLCATRPSWALYLMNAIGRKKLQGEDFIAHTINKQDVPDFLVYQIKALSNEPVIAMATRIWPAVRYATSSEKTRKISDFSAILRAGQGSVSAGRKIFMNLCAPCHRLFEVGATLGPDLTGYDRSNVTELLNNIVDPSAYVREGYVTYKISTADGRIITGSVSGRQGTTVNIVLLSGELITLPESEIKDMVAQPSMMPDNLLDHLSEDGVRDLFAYLQSSLPSGK